MSLADRSLGRRWCTWASLAVAGCNGGEPHPAILSCHEGEILDAGACVPDACGRGTWGDLPVDASTVYVDAAAGDGGDGSEAAPLTGVQAGLDLAGERGGGLVAVASGAYLGLVGMGDDHDGVTLAGRCSALVVLDGGDGGGEDDVTVEIVGGRRRPEIRVQGVTVTGGTQAGVWVEYASVVASDSVVQGNALVGILVGDGALDLEGVAVTGNGSAAPGEYGRGIDVEAAAVLSATRCTVESNIGLGLYTSGAGTTVTLTDSAILDTAPTEAGDDGRGAEVRGGAALTLTGCTISGNADVGLLAAGAGTSVTLQDTEVLNTIQVGDDAVGISCEDGASLRATACTVAGNAQFGVSASGEGTLVDLIDTLVKDTLPGPVVSSGERFVESAGIRVTDGAALGGSGCTVEGNAEWGLVAGGAGTVVVLVETAIVETRPRADDGGGGGAEVIDGASVTMTGCALTGNAQTGLVAWDDGTHVELVDTLVQTMVPSAEGDMGRGLEVYSGATLTATGCVLDGNTEVGLVAAGLGTTVTMSGCEVAGTRRSRVSGLALGLVVQEFAELNVRDSSLSGTEGPGLYAADSGVVDLDGVVFSENQFAAAVVMGGSATLSSCTLSGTTSDAEWGGGFGVYANDHFGRGSVTLVDSTVGAHDYAAVWLDGPGTYDIQRNVLSGSEGVLSGVASLHGNAVFAENGVVAWDGSTGLRLVGNTFVGTARIAVLLDASSAGLGTNTWTGDGVDVWQQRCDGIEPLSAEVLEGVPDAEVCPEGNVLTAYDLTLTSLYLPTTAPSR